MPQTTVPRDRTSPTQPFPTRPLPFDLQGSTEENLMTYTPVLHQRALDQLNAFVHGPLFTPPSLQGTITIPGNWGAASWGGASFDPDTGMLYVPSRTLMHLQRVVPGGPTDTVLFKLGSSVPRPAADAQPAPPQPGPATVDDLSLFKPPYSRVTAIDMNTGEYRWRITLGTLTTVAVAICFKTSQSRQDSAKAFDATIS